MKYLATFAVLIALACIALADPQPPKWPSRYYAKGSFKIPYWNLNEPVELWYDGVGNRELFSYYHGMDTYLWRFDTQTLYQVIPRVDKMKCFTSTGIGNGPLVTLLPDLSNWNYRGAVHKHRVQCDVWDRFVTNFNKTAHYTMYVNAQSGAPVELHLNGYDFVFGSHPDIYIMSFEDYQPNFYNASVFNAPELCSNADEATSSSVFRSRALLGQIGAMSPLEDDELTDHFDQFVLQHKKVYGNKNEYVYRRDVFLKNKNFIEEHNKRTDVTFKLGMNHLGDWTNEEVRSMLMPKPKDVDRSTINSGAKGYHQSSNKKLPSYVNWIEKGAVTFVKDQGVCGSCWTFGSTGAIEGAWAVKTGQLIPLSEQQIVDCAWGTWVTGNSGCDGGFAAPAFEWIMQNGGIATEETYPYLMQDHWCNAYDHSSGVQLTGYVNVTEYSEPALQDALANHGPVAVAIDASHPAFTYYESGVYYQPDCGYTPDQLDHEVLAVGYGTTPEGQDYWLVKNSWSTHWGDKGYVKMARNRNNNCGIASQATYPLV